MTKAPFSQRLRPETLTLLQKRGQKRNWSRREFIFRNGEPCSGVHLFLSGLVKLYRSNAAGREQIFLLEAAGSVLTLAPIFDEGEQPLTAETLKATVTLFVTGDDFLQLYAQRSDLRDAVTIELARRLRLTQGLLETIALQPVMARVATRLFELAAAHDALDGSQRFRLLLSQDEMAHVLGTSRESVARSLGELRSNGVIEQRGAHIRVTDAHALFEWSQLNGPDPATPMPAVI
jgi:CRP/FNR family transcriptional regulator